MDPAKLKVVELRAELSQRGLDTKGNKPVLVERLRKALEDESQNPPGDKTPVDSEDSSDIAQKEISEKVNESMRTLPPRTPGRASRSSSISSTTPSKISTRNAPKTATSPVSMKQLSPSKSQNIDKQAEAVLTISENSSENSEVTQENQSLSMSDKEQSNEVILKSEEPVQTEAENLVSRKPSDKVEEQEVVENYKKSEIEELDAAKASIPEEPEEANEDTVQSLEKSDSESENNVSITNEEKEKSEEVPQENQASENEEKYDDMKPIQTSEENDKMDCNDENDHILEKNDTTEVQHNIQDIKEEEITQNTETMESTDETQKKEDIPKDEQEEKAINIASENSNLVTNDETIKSEQMESEVETKKLAEEDNMNIHKENEQDVEMIEIKEEERKIEVRDSTNRNVHDRKRKRSPSPVEERIKSPEIKQPEEEPEIDYSAVILSWYDSDLNLVIDKNNFLSATPLHNDGFCYAWAGARASHGFIQGKVYYEAKITEECPVNIQNEEHPHLLRVGWSVSHTSLQLGEEKLSYGFDGTGKKVTENQFADYASAFGKDDAVGCYLDMTPESNVTISYTLNGKNLGVAFTISKEELGDKALFPHILSKNCSYSCNFGQENPWSQEILEDYVPVATANPENRISGPQRPEKKENCEIILMCGLPAAGKTCWALKHAAEHPEKMYNILGTESLLKKMTVMGTPRQQHCSDKWDELVNKCVRAVNKLQEIALGRRRNYIFDQTNVQLPTQRRKMRNFTEYQKKAVVVVPSDEEFKSRSAKHESLDSKYRPDVGIIDMKANFSIPVVGEYFDAVEWVELNEEEGKKVIEMYNKEGKDARFKQQPSKRPRFDRPDNRDNRDSRDHRDRRPNYPDRNRNASWRGGSNMSWRDRPRGGHMRHVGGGGSGGSGGGYGSGWRGGRSGPAQPPPPHRNDRRGGGNNDRRTGGDRNRSVSSRQGGSWGPMNSNYQGSQSSGGWGQGGGGWSGGGQSSWSQGSGGGGGGSGWGQQSQWGGGGGGGGSWKSYGQGSYGQSNYNQGYGNGNWNNSWNQQYYNQYWDQQQQSGQTTTPTTAAGGQAVSTTDSTMASSDNSEATYSYSEGWQRYN